MLASLVGLVIVIAVVSLLAGAVPLYFHLDLHVLSLVGSGLVLGTAFIVILPEGIEVLGDQASLTYAGFLVLVGFLFMYLLEKYMNIYMRKNTPQVDFNLADMRELNEFDPEYDPAQGQTQRARPSQLAQLLSRVDLVTLAMILHAAADGISLGAAHATSSDSLKLAVLMSLLLHKAPASFSFVSVLLAKHIPASVVKRDLLLFSCSTPATALATYFILGRVEHTAFWVASALLLSSGSFMFVANHILPDIKNPIELIVITVCAFLPLLSTLLPE